MRTLTDRFLTTGQITSIRLLLHVQDQELAIGLVEKICMHASAKKGTRSAAREDKGRLVKAIHWGFAKGSELAFLPALIAIRLGGIWLDSTVAHVEKLSRLSHDDDDYRIAVAESQMLEADLDLLRDILDFASQIIREEKPIALNCVEPNSKALLSFLGAPLMGGQDEQGRQHGCLQRGRHARPGAHSPGPEHSARLDIFPRVKGKPRSRRRGLPQQVIRRSS